ncbi:MAG: hypothetical protein QXH24_06755 [Candidatus Bathyarchaeia archaeon]
MRQTANEIKRRAQKANNEDEELIEPEKCKNIACLRENARRGKFLCCQDCPRHPLRGNPVFAEGCPLHQTESPLILFVFQDPASPKRRGVIGCSADGRVCPWCHTDFSAINFREKLFPLIKEIVPEIEVKGRYRIYCINAVLHGPRYNAPPPTRALRSCSHILKAYVRLLRPKIVMGLGIKARYSLALAFGIQNFEKAPYPVIREGIAFWWTYHQAQRSFLKKQYEIETRFKIIAEFLKGQLEGGVNG